MRTPPGDAPKRPSLSFRGGSAGWAGAEWDAGGQRVLKGVGGSTPLARPGPPAAQAECKHLPQWFPVTPMLQVKKPRRGNVRKLAQSLTLAGWQRRDPSRSHWALGPLAATTGYTVSPTSFISSKREIRHCALRFRGDGEVGAHQLREGWQRARAGCPGKDMQRTEKT